MFTLLSLDDTYYNQGAVVGSWDTIIWTERYLDAGDFTLTSTKVDAIRALLPIGTLISHQDTGEVMMVEDHDIQGASLIDGTPDAIKVTGRSVEQIAMENRLTYMNLSGGGALGFGYDSSYPDINPFAPSYILSVDNAWAHAVQLMTDSMVSSLIRTEENVPNLAVRSTISSADPTPVARNLKSYSLVVDAIKDMLSSINAGVRTERPNVSHSTLDFVVHAGADVSADVIFYWDRGDLKSARYFMSNRDGKNVAYVITQTVSYRIHDTSEAGLNIRMIKVDASDWQTTYSTSPTEEDLITNTLAPRGRDALSQHTGATVVEATASATPEYKYGSDYNIGDLVMVRGNYGVESVMRVTEYAITVDGEGEHGFPTLAQVNP